MKHLFILGYLFSLTTMADHTCDKFQVIEHSKYLSFAASYFDKTVSTTLDYYHLSYPAQRLAVDAQNLTFAVQDGIDCDLLEREFIYIESFYRDIKREHDQLQIKHPDITVARSFRKITEAINSLQRAFIVQPAPDTQTLNCESVNYQYRECFVAGRIVQAHMLQQLSISTCRYGDSWGVRNGVLWVDRGCRANFWVQYYPTQACE